MNGTKHFRVTLHLLGHSLHHRHTHHMMNLIFTLHQQFVSRLHISNNLLGGRLAQYIISPNSLLSFLLGLLRISWIEPLILFQFSQICIITRDIR